MPFTSNWKRRTYDGDVVRAWGLIVALWVAFTGNVPAQVSAHVETLVAALRPALPFPAATADGAEPVEGGAQSRWFVVWPSDLEDTRIIVKANPFHPDVQKLGAIAEVPIQQAVARAERKAQAAYERALAELKRTGKATDFDVISLDDEGIAGERIDAELELTIELQTTVQSFDILSSDAPVVSAGTNGAAWVVSIPPNTYRESTGTDTREHFRSAESRLYFGALSRPSVNRRGDGPRFAVSVPLASGAFAVVLRGNEELLKRVLATADWARLLRP